MSPRPSFPALWMIVVLSTFYKQASSICNNGCLYFTDRAPYETRQTVYNLDLSTHDVQETGVTGNNLAGLAYDVISHAIYVTDRGGTRISDGKFILRFQDHGTTKVRFPSSVGLASVAVDPISGLLYYSDVKNNVIGVYTSDLHYHHLVVPEDTIYPYSLTLDPGNGTMYWIDRISTGNEQVRKAFMDGSGIETILSRNIEQPIGLTLVREDARLYWCNNRHVIESVLTDGSVRQLVYRLNKTSQCTGMTAGDNYIYWMQVDSTTRRSTIWKLPRNGTGLPERLYNSRADINALRVMALSTVNYTNVTNQCSGSSRGGCAHLCIPTVQSRVCLCSVGYILQPDGSSCNKSEPDTGLMVVDGGRQELFVFDLVESASHPLNVTGRKWVFHGHLSPTAVAYDELNHLVFWVDSAKKHIASACFPNKPDCSHLIHGSGYGQSSKLVDIALDKKKKDVYVVDQGRQYILRTPYGGGTDVKLHIARHYELLTSIALDTDKRVMYWAVGDSQSRIERVSMDSDNPLKQYEKFIAVPNRPMALSIDTAGEKLYWAAAESGLIWSVNLDGTNATKILYEQLISAMTVGGGCLFWASPGSENKQEIQAMNLNTSLVRTYRSAVFRQITDLDYFSEEHANSICNGNGSFVPAPRVEPRRAPVVSLTIIIGSAAGGVLLITLIIVGISIWRKRRPRKPHSGDVINGPPDIEMDPVHTPPPCAGGVRAPALRPPEAMIGRPLPQAPAGAEDPRSPQPDGPAEAGFRQFLLRGMSTTAPEYQALLEEQDESDAHSYRPLNVL